MSENDAKALSARLLNELVSFGNFTVVERGEMEKILSEQDFQQTGCTTDECLVEIGKILGVEQMVGGTISLVGKTYSVSARLIDVETGELLNVTNYDRRSSIEEILTKGMKKVAAALSTPIPLSEVKPVIVEPIKSMTGPPKTINPYVMTIFFFLAFFAGSGIF